MKKILTTGVALILLAVLSLSAANTAAKVQPPAVQKHEEVLAQLQKTLTELKAAVTRIEMLEQRVLALEQANAKLQQELKEHGQPKLIPLENK